MGTPLSLSSDFFCVFYDSVREHGQSHHAYPGTTVCDGLFCRCAVQQLQQQPIQQQSELQQPVRKQQHEQQLEHEQQKHEQQQLQQHEQQQLQQQQQLEQQPEHEQQQLEH